MKLHLGCGKRDFPGFVNVDLADFPHIHHRRSVDDLAPFENESVDLIYASHVLEYFSLTQVPRVLAEWRRVLKPNGNLKIAVPDFEGLIQAYQRFGDMNKLEGVIYGLIESDDNSRPLFHKTMYDFKLLEKTLQENGFTNIQKYDWRDFLPAGSEDHSAAYIPSRDFDNGILVSLNIEATKTGLIEHQILKTKHLAENIAKRAIHKLKKLI